MRRLGAHALCYMVVATYPGQGGSRLAFPSLIVVAILALIDATQLSFPAVCCLQQEPFAQAMDMAATVGGTRMHPACMMTANEATSASRCYLPPRVTPAPPPLSPALPSCDAVRGASRDGSVTAPRLLLEDIGHVTRPLATLHLAPADEEVPRISIIAPVALRGLVSPKILRGGLPVKAATARPQALEGAAYPCRPPFLIDSQQASTTAMPRAFAGVDQRCAVLTQAGLEVFQVAHHAAAGPVRGKAQDGEGGFTSACGGGGGSLQTIQHDLVAHDRAPRAEHGEVVLQEAGE